MPGIKAKQFRHQGGVIRLRRDMITSPQWRALSSHARALIIELQAMWRPGTATYHLSARRAGELLGMGKDIGNAALHEVRDAKFIILADESDFPNKKARTYRLTWETFDGREPTNEWASVPAPEKKSASAIADGRGSNRRARQTVEGSAPVNRRARQTVTTKHQALTGAATAPTV